MAKSIKLWDHREGPQGNFELSIDLETQESLRAINRKHEVQSNVVPGVRTVLVVLSSTSMVLDAESLRQKILYVYPNAAVFFMTTSAKPLGVAAPKAVDLLIDLTGPGQRQSFFMARRLRRMVKLAVGRNAGFFRKRIYDRVFDEKDPSISFPHDRIEKEWEVQIAVLGLAGVPVTPEGGLMADLSKSIALNLPPLAKG